MALKKHSFMPEDVSPTSDESILFESNVENGEIIFEFFKDGGIVVLERTDGVNKLSEIALGQIGETVAGLKNVPA